MEYKVVENNYLDSFQNEINSLLKQNWELQGGVSTVYRGEYYGCTYSQAMVRKK